MNKCFWVNDNPNYIKYHDTEWGVPSFDDRYLFEMLVLESFQAGLSWEIILNKRDSFKESFDYFDYNKIAKYDDKKIEQLLNNKNIIRNRLKINAAINNSKVFIKIRDEFGSFSNYIWSFTNNKVIVKTEDKNIVNTSLSDKISKDLKSRGMKFVGSTIIYSYLQAIGVVNDHDLDCDFRRK